MPSRAWTSYGVCLACACLFSPLLGIAGQGAVTSLNLRRQEIVVWKVGSPYRDNAPEARVPILLARAAEQMGLEITVRSLPAKGFAQQFFDAVNQGQEPDLLVINNFGIIDGITTPLGDFTGIGTDKTVRKTLVGVTNSLNGFAGWDAFTNLGLAVYLVTSSKHSEAARAFAIRSPDCHPNWAAPPLTSDLQEAVDTMARAYLQGNQESFAAWEDPDRLHSDVENPKRRNILKMQPCGFWGDDRLAFVPVVSSYESPTTVGHISLLLILRQHAGEWKVLTASTDPITLSSFTSGIPRLVKLLQGVPTPGENPIAAKLLAPVDGRSPMPSGGQRFGDYVWRPSPSTDVVAQVVEFAYQDDARLFLRLVSGNSQPDDRISDGLLWTSRSLWQWRVWSISETGAITFSDVRSFGH